MPFLVFFNIKSLLFEVKPDNVEKIIRNELFKSSENLIVEFLDTKTNDITLSY